MDKNDRLPSLRNIARVLCLGGGALLALTLIAFVATAIYETVVPPTDMHLAGLLTAAMLLFVAPIGGVLLVFGVLMWIVVSLVGRRSKRERTDTE